MTYSNTIEEKSKLRGERLTRFRKEHLHVNQKKVAKDNDISQSVISAYESGRVPSPEIMEYYAERGMNIHWYYTGQGPMVYRPEMNVVREDGVGYDVIRGQMEFVMSDHPLDIFLVSMDNVKDIRLEVLGKQSLSDDERATLTGSLVKKVKEKVTIL